MNNPKSEAQPEKRDVAVYLDFENLYVSLKTTAKMDPNFDILMEKCREFGRVILARAYADWSEFSRMYTSQMFANGLEPVYVPTRKIYDSRSRSEARKNSVDIHITIDIIKSLFLHENVDVIILISGDRDYVPLINQIRQSGKDVYAIGVAGCTSSELSIAVDEMFFYHQLLDTGDKEEPQVDIYNTLLKALRIANRRGYPATLGILKPIMKELVEGFDERNYKTSRGTPFQKFKDIVLEAERRRLVRLVTSGATTEVYLWAEAPKSTTTSARRDDAAPTATARRDEAAPPTRERGGRRRRGRGSERAAEPVAAPSDSETTDVVVDDSSDPGSRPAVADSQARANDGPANDARVDEAQQMATKSGQDEPRSDVIRRAASAEQPSAPDDEKLTGVKCDDATWTVIRDAVLSFEPKPPTPRKLMLELKKARGAGAFGEVHPTDADLDDLIGRCVDSGRLRRERKGFSSILRLTDQPQVESPTEA